MDPKRQEFLKRLSEINNRDNTYNLRESVGEKCPEGLAKQYAPYHKSSAFHKGFSDQKKGGSPKNPHVQDSTDAQAWDRGAAAAVKHSKGGWEEKEEKAPPRKPLFRKEEVDNEETPIGEAKEGNYTFKFLRTPEDEKEKRGLTKLAKNKKRVNLPGGLKARVKGVNPQKQEGPVLSFKTEETEEIDDVLEELEQINELSNKVLGRYLSKAAEDQEERGNAIKKLKSAADSLGDRDGSVRGLVKKEKNKYISRQKGMWKADEKYGKNRNESEEIDGDILEELEQINEISDNVLKRYLRKSTRD